MSNIILITFLLFTSISFSHPKELFNVRNIKNIVSINNKQYYKASFSGEIYNTMYKSKETYIKFIKNPLVKNYNVNIDKDTILFENESCKPYLFKDVLFKKGSEKITVYTFCDIYIPIKKDIKVKKDYSEYIKTNNFCVNTKKNKAEIGKYKTDLEADSFLKRKAIELYDSTLPIEHNIITIATYSASLIDYDNTLNTIGYESSHSSNILNNGVGVCEAYTTLFTIMIDTIYKIDKDLTGHGTIITNHGKVSHIHNFVLINGLHYEIDITGINAVLNSHTSLLTKKSENRCEFWGLEEYCLSRYGIYVDLEKERLNFYNSTETYCYTELDKYLEKKYYPY